MREAEFKIETADGVMDTFFCHPDEGGPFLAVIMYMDAPGIREELRDMARRIGTTGYYVLLPNLYYRIGREGSRAATRRAPAVTGPDAPITRHGQRAPARTAPLRQNAAATSTNPPDNGVNAGFGQQSRRQATGCLPNGPFTEIISPVDNHMGMSAEKIAGVHFYSGVDSDDQNCTVSSNLIWGCRLN